MKTLLYLLTVITLFSGNAIQGKSKKAPNGSDTYYVGDWDGDGRSNIAVRRGATFYYDYNFDGKADGIQTYGNGDSEDQYLVGDWDGDGRTMWQ